MILALGIGGCVAAPAPETAPAAASPVTERAYFVRGMGIVVGLDGTGDSPDSMRDVVRQFGLERVVAGRNMALVAVTGQVPAGAGPGRSLPVQVSAIGEATSLRGGTLFLTALRTVDETVGVLGIAQGAVSVDSIHATTGTIQQGMTLEKLPPLSRD